MKNPPDDTESTPSRKSATDDQFRAVVKRLLDTPPMHKPPKNGVQKPKAKSRPKRS